MIYRDWVYEVRDQDTDTLLMTDRNFETESDAELQGTMDAKAVNLRNFYVRTYQPPYTD